MLEIAVIADDLTGAADTGVQFCRLASPNYLLEAEALINARLPDTPKAVTVHTTSRHLPPMAAHDAVIKAARELKRFKPKRIYKKVDSCLRGNLGAEIDALLDELNLDVAFVAPAFPSQGRVTIHDEHLIHGVPVAKTEIANDPINPVLKSHVTEVLKDQSEFDVGHIDIEIVAKGGELLNNAVLSLIESGKKLIVLDANEQFHLKTVASLALDGFKNSLLVGSAGLALGLVQALEERKNKKCPTPPKTSGPLLFVGGSASERLALQQDALVNEKQSLQMVLDAALLADPKAHIERLVLGSQAASSLNEKHLVLRVTPPENSDDKPDADLVAKGLAQVAALAAEKSSPSGIFLSGGDTAVAVLKEMGAYAVELHDEILPGLVWGTMLGGVRHGGLVVTKAGAFGQDDALLKLHGLLCDEA